MNGPINGAAERDALRALLSQLAGGRVFNGAAPDDNQLPRSGDGKIMPYIVTRFSQPQWTRQGRNIATGEQGQPHVLTGTIVYASGDADWTETLAAEGANLVIGVQLTPSSTPLQARGGFSWNNGDSSSRPTRFQEHQFVRTFLNF